MAPIPPLCWKCRYDLTGSYVEDVCPECGTPVWSAPPTDEIAPNTLKALYAAGLGAVLLFVWMGPTAPLAIGAGVYAIVRASRVTNDARFGRTPATNIQPARIAFWVGLGTIIAGSWLSVRLLMDLVRDLF